MTDALFGFAVGQGHPAGGLVEGGALRRGQAAVEHVADQDVDEPNPAGGRPREHAGAHRFLQIREQLLRGHVEHGGQPSERELRAQHRSGPERVPGPRRQHLEVHSDGLAHLGDSPGPRSRSSLSASGATTGALQRTASRAGARAGAGSRADHPSAAARQPTVDKPGREVGSYGSSSSPPLMDQPLHWV